MTQHVKFNAKLEEILYEFQANELLSIPGVYDIVSKYYHNIVLEAIKKDEELEKESV